MNYGPEEVFSFVVGLIGSLVGYLFGWFGSHRNSGSQFVSALCPDCSPVLHCHPSPPIAAACHIALFSWTGFACGIGLCATGFVVGACRPRLSGWATSQHRAVGGASLSIGERPAAAVPRARLTDGPSAPSPTSTVEPVVWQSRRRSPASDGSEPGLR